MGRLVFILDVVTSSTMIELDPCVEWKLKLLWRAWVEVNSVCFRRALC